MSNAKIILVVDDDESIIFAITTILESEGYLVQTAKNGYEALNLLESRGIPHLILLDMKMPTMDGWEFAAQFNNRHDHQAPIIVMTAAGDAKRRAQEVQADAWLGKPFSLDDLTSAVKRYARD